MEATPPPIDTLQKTAVVARRAKGEERQQDRGHRKSIPRSSIARSLPVSKTLRFTHQDSRSVNKGISKFTFAPSRPESV